jgi:phage terminase large subunit
MNSGGQLRTKVFLQNIKAFNRLKGTSSLIANQGGQGSSKTRSIIQLLIILALLKKRHITISAYALPHLKAGAMMDMDAELLKLNIDPNSVKNISESIYYLGESKIEFVGIEGNEARVTGPRRDILYINEANKRINYDVFELMNARTSEMTFIDFNPSREFWFHEKIMPNFSYELIKSTYLDNPYLPARELENLLSKKDKPGFENWWKVYGLGELGQLEDAILTNWRFGEFDNSLPYGYGQDFGSKHPDALVKVAVDKENKKLYWKEEIYQNGLSTGQLSAIMKTRNLGNKIIIADSAATRTIEDLKLQGFNIKPVEKGRIIDDIKMLWEYEIIVDPTSYNLAKELNNWIWLDKKGEIPIDENDDLIDAARYYTRFVVKPVKEKRGHKAL